MTSPSIREENEAAYLPSKTYKYGLSYKLNYLPGLLFVLAVYAVITFLPSSNKNIGYFFWSAVVCLVVFLFIKERKRIATEVRVNDLGITAHHFNSNEISMCWNDIDSVVCTGKGLWLVSFKIEKYLYTEIVSKNNERIIIRRELEGYRDLISTIERKTGIVFSTH